MKQSSHIFLCLSLPLGLTLSGCVASSASHVSSAIILPEAKDSGDFTTPIPAATTKASVEVIPVGAEEPARVRPAYAQLETLPIDLPTVMRMVNENSPSIGFAQARVREAQARLENAELQWVPHLSLGAAYSRFDGQTQNQRGEVFGVSRANLFSAVAPTLSVDTAEAIYRPLIERRLNTSEQLREQAVNLAVELEAVGAYLDLVQIYAQIEINAETMKNAEALLNGAKNAREFKLDRTAGDVNRAQTEVLFRRVERIELLGKAGMASARLGKLLIMQPNVKLVPADKIVAPVTLVEANRTLDDLLAQAFANRPDLAANREIIEAAWLRVRKAERGPLWPKIAISNQTGAFGGGINDQLGDFSSRNALSAQLYWEIRNLGFGNRAEAAERQAVLDQANFQLIDAQARAVSEIVEAAQLAAARYESLDLAEQAVKEATELYRINLESITNVVDPKNLVDALRPLQALQALNQARLGYVNAILDFNRAQYRLFTAVGQSPKQK